jgi:SPP1 family holin
MNKGTIVRFQVLILALVNQFLASKGLVQFQLMRKLFQRLSQQYWIIRSLQR